MKGPLILISLFLIACSGVVIYKQVFLRNDGYVLRIIKSDYKENEEAWNSLFKICDDILVNNPDKEIEISMYVNQGRVFGNVNDVSGNKVELQTYYSSIYNILDRLDVSHIYYLDGFYYCQLHGFSLERAWFILNSHGVDFTKSLKNIARVIKLRENIYIMHK